MVSESIRLVACVFVGLFAGRVLGPLFVPDPTSTLAIILTGVVALGVGGGLYRSAWLQ
ncbi:hypothetical protein ACFQH3_09085 [Haladaptatus sp. GCM10025707]|uniref:hypothetical protein n=1 Tax=unclassified Haladaptatus TaxID=2622732 RepID=UPI0023E7D50B|nr:MULTISPECIES: hypothetical protein [unclassified Haladaptatus]